MTLTKKFSWFKNQGKKLKSLLFIPFLLIFIPLIFFYKTIFFGLIPFPGDLLVSNYEPYKSLFVGIPSKGQGADVIRELYPWKYFSMEQIKKGNFPLWNPYSFSGNTQFANLQSGTLYPINVLFFVLPFVDAWTIYIILQFILMYVFTYLFLREIKLSKLSSLIGSTAFSFSAFITVWSWYGNLGHTILYLPLAFYFLEKIFNTKKYYWFFLLALTFSISIFAGYIQFVMYVYILSGAYVAARFFTNKKRDLRLYVFIFLSFTAGLLLSAIQVIPIFEVVRLSLRSNYSYQTLLERLMPPESIITLLIPDFFGNPATMNYFLRGGSSLERAVSIGVWPLIFATLAVFSKKSFNRNFFAISALIILISILSIPPIAFFHSIGIPFLSTGIPTRALAIFCFCLAVLAAIGVDSFQKSKNKKSLTKIIIVFGLIFIVLLAGTYIIRDPNLLISRRNIFLPLGVFVIGCFLLLVNIPKKYSLSLILTLTVFELFYSFQKFNSFVPKSYVYPKTEISTELKKIQGIDRSWGYGNAYIDSNFSLIEENYSTEGYDPLFSKRYGELTAASENGRVPKNLERAVAGVFKGYGVNDLKDNPYRKRALDLLGVKYVLNKNFGLDSAFSELDFKLIWQGNNWQIYQNLNNLPRVKLFGNYKIEDKNKIIKDLYDKNFDIHKTVILENTLDKNYNIKSDPSASARLISYGPNKVDIETNSKEDQVLFISDNYFPGWHAKVDGVETPIFIADYTFRAVPLKKGKHTIEISYSPLSFWLGLWISLGALISLILIFVFVKLKKTSK